MGTDDCRLPTDDELCRSVQFWWVVPIRAAWHTRHWRLTLPRKFQPSSWWTAVVHPAAELIGAEGGATRIGRIAPKGPSRASLPATSRGQPGWREA